MTRLEVVFRADGQREHQRLGGQVGHDHVHRPKEVGAHAVHLRGSEQSLKKGVELVQH